VESTAPEPTQSEGVVEVIHDSEVSPAARLALCSGASLAVSRENLADYVR
jgi:hypothetical protein